MTKKAFEEYWKLLSEYSDHERRSLKPKTWSRRGKAIVADLFWERRERGVFGKDDEYPSRQIHVYFSRKEGDVVAEYHVEYLSPRRIATGHMALFVAEKYSGTNLSDELGLQYLYIGK